MVVAYNEEILIKIRDRVYSTRGKKPQITKVKNRVGEGVERKQRIVLFV